MELDAALVVASLLDNLFRAGELLILGHPVNGRAEVFRRKRGDANWMESLDPGLGAQLQSDGRVGTDFTNGSPERK